MQKFVITTENTSDLPHEYYEQNDILYMYLPCTMEGGLYKKDNELPYQEFYSRMRSGAMPTTSQVNSEDAKAEWVPLIKAGKEILHLAFSSGLSGTYNSCRIAAEELREEYPDCKIVVIDSLCASLGQGLYVDKAVQMKNSGKTIEETAAWLEANKMKVCQVFTVDDLNHLYRGGRVSKLTAILGTMINIKPMLHVNEEGLLLPVGKVRGRKRSLMALVDLMEERLKGYTGEKGKVYISHGDCEADAQFVAKHIEERLGYHEFLINPIGATIGAHAGPGTVALFFMGDHR